MKGSNAACIRMYVYVGEDEGHSLSPRRSRPQSEVRVGKESVDAGSSPIERAASGYVGSVALGMIQRDELYVKSSIQWAVVADAMECLQRQHPRKQR